MESAINIKVINVYEDDGSIQYDITFSNGQTHTDLDFYGYYDTFQKFGERLVNYPQHIHDKVKLEIGSEDKRSAYHILLEVFCYEPNGKSAIKIIVDNHAIIPYFQRCEFYILSEPANLNRLGQGLKMWNPLEEKEYKWI